MFHTDQGGGFDNAKIDGLLDVFDIRRSPSRKGDPVRQRRGRIHQQAPEEGAHIPEPLHQPGTTTLRPQRLCVVVRQPKTPLHPRIPEPQRIHTTRTRPLRTCPTRRCQSTCTRNLLVGLIAGGLLVSVSSFCLQGITGLRSNSTDHAEADKSFENNDSGDREE